MYAELSIDHRILKDIVEKNVTSTERKLLVEYAINVRSAGVHRAYRLLSLSRSVYQYEPKLADDGKIKTVLKQFHYI